MERCLLCEPERSRVLADTGKAYAIYSLWPVSDYHTLLVPWTHHDNESDLNREENDELLQLRKVVVGVIGEKYGITAYNFGANIGKEAGQTSPHLHYHVIFRVAGDAGDSTGGVRAVIKSKADPGLQEGNGLDKVSKWTQETKTDFQTWVHRNGITVKS
jgi:ATP adenylyltransferase